MKYAFVFLKFMKRAGFGPRAVCLTQKPQAQDFYITQQN